MSIDENGENLIFIISQPRSGSTLLQKILAGHPDIQTFSEPWIMLHPLYALREGGHTAEYNSKLAHEALEDFLSMLNRGEEVYYQGLRRMFASIYSSCMEDSSASLFLDKTPRYYYVIPQLLKVFPKAKFLILLRNPIAVMTSIYKTWVRSDWNNMSRFSDDLLKAPMLLLRGVETLDARVMMIHYENLLDDPAKVIADICEWLDIKCMPELVSYGDRNTAKWYMGDQSKVNSLSMPLAENKDSWILNLGNVQLWRCTHEYLQFLGEDTIEEMGYSFSRLSTIIHSNKPNWMLRKVTCPLGFILKPPSERSDCGISLYAFKAWYSFKKRGLIATIRYILEKFINASIR